jgi:hypothetical protein
MNFRFIKTDHFKLEANKGGGFALKFKLSDVQTSIEWDYYRLNKVVVKIIPRFNPSFNESSTMANGMCASMIDLDDSTAPMSFEDICDHQNARLFQNSRIHTRQWVPVAHDALEGQSAGTFYAGLKKRPWINAGYTGVTHYGLKFWMANNGPHAIEYDLVMKYYFSFKQPIIKK